MADLTSTMGGDGGGWGWARWNGEGFAVSVGRLITRQGTDRSGTDTVKDVGGSSRSAN